MAKRAEYTVRCLVPDETAPGGYVPLESLTPEKRAALGERLAERIAGALMSRWNAEPAIWARDMAAVGN